MSLWTVSYCSHSCSFQSVDPGVSDISLMLIIMAKNSHQLLDLYVYKILEGAAGAVKLEFKYS